MGWGSGIAMSCGVSHRCGSDPALLWLWLWPAAVALIQPLAWELSYALGAALKKSKKKKGHGLRKIYHNHTNQKKVGVAKLISDGADLKQG